MNKEQMIMQLLTQERVNGKISELVKELKHTPYQSSRAYAAGVQCGMHALVACLIEAGLYISINKKRKKRNINVKRSYTLRSPIVGNRMRKYPPKNRAI